MRISLPSGTTAELARPSGDPTMGLVVIPDIMGLRPLFDEHCARLAQDNGWAVCAFELFAGREHLDRDARMIAAKDNDDTRILGDALAAARATGCERVGIVGFCMGGMYALKSVRTGRFARTVAFYGMIRVPEQWRGPGHREPLDALETGDATSVLEIVGTIDTWTPPADVAALEATGATVVRYEGADHAFAHDPARPVHRPADAADAWSRAMAWLRS
ncbi:MAG TPA: dienelactone hydrolase family protein [Acidimicrobiales bacterium]|jgi:carboxymethylenebutenolidase|nr:dienelactone hydrolase family protein [Acidimicrobiales bacterium]